MRLAEAGHWWDRQTATEASRVEATDLASLVEPLTRATVVTWAVQILHRNQGGEAA